MSSSRKLFPSLAEYDLVLKALEESRDTLDRNLKVLHPADQTCIDVKKRLNDINSDITKLQAHLNSTFAVFKKDKIKELSETASEKTKAQLRVVEKRTKEIIEEKKRAEAAAKERRERLEELERRISDLAKNLKSAHTRTLSAGNNIAVPILSQEKRRRLAELDDEPVVDKDTTPAFRRTEEVYFASDIDWNHTRVDTPEPEHNPLPLPPPRKAVRTRSNIHATSRLTQGEERSTQPAFVEGSSRAARANVDALSVNALSLEDPNTQLSDTASQIYSLYGRESSIEAEESSVGHGSHNSGFSIDTEAFGNHR